MSNDSTSTAARELDFRGGSPGRTIVSLLWPERRQLAVSCIFWVIKSSPIWALPIITANLIDLVASPQRHRPSSLWWNVGVGTVLILQNALTHVWHNNALSLAVRRVETRLRSMLCRHLQELSISYFKHTSTGLLQSKAMRDVENIGLATRELCNTGINTVVTILVSLIVTAVRVPWFLPVFVLTTPLVAGLHMMLRRRLDHANTRFRREFEGLSARFLGMLDMIPVTRAHALEDTELAQIQTRLGQVQEVGLQLDKQNGVVNSAAWVVLTQFGLLGLGVTAWLSYRKILPLTPGDVVLMSGYFSTLTGILVGFLNMLPLISRGLESVRSIGEVLECPDLEENQGKRWNADVRGAFEFENVSFAYPGQPPGEPALSGLNLRVEPGETIGLVGASGSGKSTVMGLLLGFQRPTRGRILLDGSDMNSLDLRSFRQRLAVVSQETILFDGTVRENILYGARGTSEARLREVLEDANAAEFIDRLPQGLATPLGENGARLSGGQRQRIAIARALIRSPRVLILDEATSALDAGSEAVVQEALDRLMVNRTTFVVAHRLSTLRKAGRIAVLDGGKLVEIGTPGDLLARGGAFARLHSIQSLSAAG